MGMSRLLSQIVILERTLFSNQAGRYKPQQLNSTEVSEFKPPSLTYGAFLADLQDPQQFPLRPFQSGYSSRL